MRAIPEGESKLRTLLQQLHENTNQEEAERWIALIRSAFSHPQIKGGMRGWVVGHDTQQVEVLQASYSRDGYIQKLWAPGARRMKTDPFSVRFFTADGDEGSKRQIAGNVTLATTESTYVGYNESFLQVFVYHVADEERKV